MDALVGCATVILHKAGPAEVCHVGVASDAKSGIADKRQHYDTVLTTVKHITSVAFHFKVKVVACLSCSADAAYVADALSICSRDTHVRTCAWLLATTVQCNVFLCLLQRTHIEALAPACLQALLHAACHLLHAACHLVLRTIWMRSVSWKRCSRASVGNTCRLQCSFGMTASSTDAMRFVAQSCVGFRKRDQCFWFASKF